MKFLYALLTLLFIAFAILQWNDSDGIIWMLTYGTVAFGFFCATLGNYFFKHIFWLIVLFTIWLITYIPHVVVWVELGMPSIVEEMSAANGYIENTRESLGLALALISLLIMYWVEKTRAEMNEKLELEYES